MLSLTHSLSHCDRWALVWLETGPLLHCCSQQRSSVALHILPSYTTTTTTTSPAVAAALALALPVAHRASLSFTVRTIIADVAENPTVQPPPPLDALAFSNSSPLLRRILPLAHGPSFPRPHQRLYHHHPNAYNMAQVMAPGSTSAPMTLSPEPDDDAESQAISRPRPQAREPRILSYADNRMSSYSKRSSKSRPQSNVGPPYPSTLYYAYVRDFAYPSYHPLHYGAPPETPSGASTPNSDWNAGRRQSESAEGSTTTTGRGSWIAGPWGGDGAIYGEPGEHMDPLPSTAFGNATEDWASDEALAIRMNKHRKSKSFTDDSHYERGRRRTSNTRSADYSLFSGTQGQYDPAGRDALRQSRGFVGQETGDQLRRDSHLHSAATATLPSRSFHTGEAPLDPDEGMPLDIEPIDPEDDHSPQRESLGPEDEDLFAGPSLALYSFEPENANELQLIEGQTIMVSYRYGQGWLVAENRQTGEQGLVPEQYVRLLRDIDGWDEEKGGFVDDDELVGDVVTPKSEQPDDDLPQRHVHVPNRVLLTPGRGKPESDPDFDAAMKEMSMDSPAAEESVVTEK